MILGDSRLRGNDGEKKPLICLTSFPRKRESILSYALLNKPFCSFLQSVCERDSSGNPLPIPMAEIEANSPVTILSGTRATLSVFEDF